MTAEVQAEPGASGLCPGKWRAARVGVGPGEGWETRGRRVGQHLVASGRHWLSRLEAGTPLNLHHAVPTGQSRLAAEGRSKEGEFTAG